MQLTIDPEFRDKIPPLSAEEFKKLEENIMVDGEVREPLVLWHNTIIDGHHRWQIIQKHPEIAYKVKRMDFPDKWAAIVWMCRNQLGRRNLTDEQQSYLRGKQYEAERMTQGTNNQYVRAKSENGQNVHFHSNRETKDGTAGRIGRENGVDGRTIRRDADFAKSIDEAESISPGFRDAVLSGEIKTPKSVISEIRNIPEEKRTAVVEAIKQGDVDTAKAAIRSAARRPEAKPERELPPFSANDFKGLIDAAVAALDASLKQHMVLVHREMLDTKAGRTAAAKALNDGQAVIEKYLNMIRMVEENGECA